MSYCPLSGRTINEDDGNCANCARKLYLDISGRPVPAGGRWVMCPKCHGSGIVKVTDGNSVRKVNCDNPGCRNGHVWADR